MNHFEHEPLNSVCFIWHKRAQEVAAHVDCRRGTVANLLFGRELTVWAAHRARQLVALAEYRTRWGITPVERVPIRREELEA